MATKIILVLACSLFALAKSSDVSDTKNLGSNVVCKPVAGIFGPMGGSKESTERGIQPVQKGEVGPIGQPGKIGNKGPRGTPDYNVIESIADKAVKTVTDRLQAIQATIEELRENHVTEDGSSYVKPTVSPEVIKNAKDCQDKYKSPISVGTDCYRIIGGEGMMWTFEAAESNCTKLGGYLADLDTKDVYDKIYDYVDETYSTVVQAWTGMRYENETLLKTNGNHTSYTKWMAYNPRKGKTAYSSYYHSYTYVYVNVDTSSRVNGLQNIYSSRKLTYALCYFNLSGTPTQRSTTTQTTTTASSDYEDYYDYA